MRVPLLFFLWGTVVDASTVGCKSSTSVGAAGQTFNEDIVSTSPAHADFMVDIRGTAADFTSRTAKTTVWFRFQLGAAECIVDSSNSNNNCQSPLFQLPVSLFRTPLTVASGTLLQNTQTLAPDVAFDFSGLSTGYTVSTFKNTKVLMQGRWGFWTDGCNPPQLKLRVEWKRSSSCWNRRVLVTGVRTSTLHPMTCQYMFTHNGVRQRLEEEAGGSTAQSRRQAVETWLSEQTFASASSSGSSMLLGPTHIQKIIECVQPSGGGNVLMGGKWDYTADGPGLCVPCAQIATASSSHIRVRACNRTWSEDRYVDCCFGCAVGYMSASTEPLQCVEECKRGFYYTPNSGVCRECPTGTYSPGKAATVCTRCAGNAYADRVHGCVSCGARARVTSQGDACSACEPWQLVLPSKDVCSDCVGATYVPETVPQPTACTACSVGSYMNRVGLGMTTCMQCPLHTFSSRNGSVTCTNCSAGWRSVPNRTLCEPCPPLLAASYVEYYRAGCAVRCKPHVAYLHGNVYATDGCRPCADVVRGVGMYADPHDCSQSLRCTNAKIYPNTEYTSASVGGANNCSFRCTPGFKAQSVDAVYGRPTVCEACSSAMIDSTKYVWTDGCQKVCRPYLYAGDCSTPCVNLADEYASGRITQRVSQIMMPSSRFYYQFDVCGTASNEAYPRSDLPALRRGLWVHRSASIVSGGTPHCGNSLLDGGEECDDGNAQGDDGCSATCQVETNRFWDCDLIGAPCLADCGWSASNGGMRGYVFPSSCPTPPCLCTNLSYYRMLQTVPVSGRGSWMSQHLIPCHCNGHPLRTVPYEQCTQANRGCRMCESNEYHDDVRSMCVRCGSDCLPGYQQAAASSDDFCGNSLSTSYLYNNASALLVSYYTSYKTAYSLVEWRQMQMGCIRCSLTYYDNVHWVHQCLFSCFKDTTGEDTTSDTYCSQQPTTLTLSTGAIVDICGGECRQCSSSQDDAIRIINNNNLKGKYITSCRDGAGHELADCTSSKPAYAHYTTSSFAVVGDSTGCKWECDINTFPQGAQCVPCVLSFSSAASSLCPLGQKKVSCGNSYYHTCVPCEGTPQWPMQVWSSTAEGECVADCEEGVAWALASNQSCSACTPNLACELGQYLVPCTRRADAYCTACGALLSKEEYVTPGSCVTRCVSGFYYSDKTGTCQQCSQAQICAVGQTLSSDCIDPAGRFAKPTCIDCVPPLGEYEKWGLAVLTTAGLSTFGYPVCGRVCDFGRLSSNCSVRCSPALCAWGQRGICQYANMAMWLECVACPLLKTGERWVAPGDCSVECGEGFLASNGGSCTPVIIPPSSSPPSAVAGRSDSSSSSMMLLYPTRQRRHTVGARTFP